MTRNRDAGSGGGWATDAALDHALGEPGMPPLVWAPVVYLPGGTLVALSWPRPPGAPPRYAAQVWRDVRGEPHVAWEARNADGDWLAAGRVPDGHGAIEEAQAMALRVLRAWARQGRT